MSDLNLLNPTRLRTLSMQESGRRAARTSIVIIGILLLTGAALWSISMSLEQKASQYNRELNQTRLVSPTGKDLPVTETTKRINVRLATLKPILDDPLISPIVQKFTAALPAGVSLISLQIDTKSGVITARGVASTRNQIPELQAGLDALDIITKPIVKSNINDRTNVQFDLTATLKPQTSPTP